MRVPNKASNVVRTFEGARNEHQEKVLEGVAIWASYYRANIHRFVEDYFHIQLKLFQIFLLYMMNVCSTFVFIACRGRLYRHAKGADRHRLVFHLEKEPYIYPYLASLLSNKWAMSGQNR